MGIVNFIHLLYLQDFVGITLNGLSVMDNLDKFILSIVGSGLIMAGVCV